MKLTDVLHKNDFTPEIINTFLQTGIQDLYPPQAEAIKKGVLDGKNLLLSIPTAAGKTFIAELAMAKALQQKKGRCLYIAPLKALASEKYKDFCVRFEKLGFKVDIAVGDENSSRQSLSKADILIATAEKVDSLLRSRSEWLINSLAVVILDEIHFINDGERGPTLEILAARIRQLNSHVQFLSLSATVKNADEMADWLKSELVKSTWRPIPLKEGVFYNDKIIFEDAPTRVINDIGPDEINNLVLDTLHGKGQVLIFVNSRRSAQAVSREISISVSKTLTAEERTRLAQISEKIAGSRADATKLCHKLAAVVKNGSAFHHAGLKPYQRELIEENFKANLIKVISCTPTLAAGVNLPARRAIIRDVKRFEAGLGSAYIPTSEYKQCAGRAGRPQYDDHGEAVIIAKTQSETSLLFDRYINAEPEPVISKLDGEAALRMHVLASIAGGYVNSLEGMYEFISHTFLYHQRADAALLESIGDIFDFLTDEGFISKSGTRYFTTPLGSLTSRLYIDPLSSIIIRDGIKLSGREGALPAIGAIHLVTCCPDHPMLSLAKKDPEELNFFASHYANDMIITPENYSILEDYYLHLRSLKTTWLIWEWINEEKEDDICEKFNVGPGDVYRFVEATGRLIYAALSIADLLMKKKTAFQFGELKTRIQYGVKEELLELIQLKGVGRVRARNLFSAGYTDMTTLKKASSANIAQIPAIGNALAKDILDQIAAKRK
jgi:helicase